MEKDTRWGIRSLILLCIALGACQGARFQHRRDVLANEALWLSRLFDKRSKVGDAVLRKQYGAAKSLCESIIEVSKSKDAIYLDNPEKIGELECQLDTMRANLAEIARLVERKELLGHRLIGIAEDLTEAANASAGVAKAKDKKPADGMLPTAPPEVLAERVLSRAAALLAADDKAGLTRAIEAAEKTLREVTSVEGSKENAIRQAAMKVAVDSRKDEIAKMLVAENAKKADSSRA